MNAPVSWPNRRFDSITKRSWRQVLDPFPQIFLSPLHLHFVFVQAESFTSSFYLLYQIHSFFWKTIQIIITIFQIIISTWLLLPILEAATNITYSLLLLPLLYLQHFQLNPFECVAQYAVDLALLCSHQTPARLFKYPMKSLTNSKMRTINHTQLLVLDLYWYPIWLNQLSWTQSELSRGPTVSMNGASVCLYVTRDPLSYEYHCSELGSSSVGRNLWVWCQRAVWGLIIEQARRSRPANISSGS